jgi:dephospho-CoA kinase
MKLIGLTGGIGMGKSTSDNLLRRRGIPVIDTDLIARQLVEPGQPALAEIQDAFGPEILDSAGHLRRGELARRVFQNPAARNLLEGILHPRIRAAWQSHVASCRSNGHSLCVVVIPLLFETNAGSQFDATICVACSAPSQHARLLSRGWPPEHISQRIAAQWPVDAKIAKSNYLIWTEAGLDVHAEQLDRILAQLKGQGRADVGETNGENQMTKN